MKGRIFTLFLSVLLGFKPAVLMSSEADVLASATLKEIVFEEDEFADSAALETELQNESYSRSSDINSLLNAKFKMISGELRQAKSYLNRIDDEKSRLFSIKKRYLALIAFIEGNFVQSLDYLSDKRFFSNSQYPKVCLLKLINYMALNDLHSLNEEKQTCMFYSGKTSKNDQYWLDTMVKLKLKNTAGVRRNLITDVEGTLSDDEMSKLWLKTGLYLNKEKEILNMISILPESSYQSKRLREIVAFMYLRSGTAADKQKALAFIDDIDTANAENIKGNINLQNKEYELAFGHFRLALQKKQDSTNSLERAIPLAWLLGQWSDGLAMLTNNTNKSLDPRNISAIRIAFLIRDKQFTQAQKELTLLKIDFHNEPPFEVSIMDSYVALMMGAADRKFDKRKVEESTENACRNFDGISCWISLQFVEWENLGKTIKRDDEIFTDKDMTIESLKEKKMINPLKETVTVDQRDIEELDGAGIELMKIQGK
ncbi:MAG: hypothetical protein WC635_15070 [Bacteriovorax sp.]|jgi:hypothetical protein